MLNYNENILNLVLTQKYDYFVLNFFWICILQNDIGCS